VFYPEKNTYSIMGTLEVLGPRGYWGVELITLTNSVLNFCPIFKKNHVEVVELISMGILSLGMSCHLT
jgi:hypothetical protein